MCALPERSCEELILNVIHLIIHERRLITAEPLITSTGFWVLCQFLLSDRPSWSTFLWRKTFALREFIRCNCVLMAAGQQSLLMTFFHVTNMPDLCILRSVSTYSMMTSSRYIDFLINPYYQSNNTWVNCSFKQPFSTTDSISDF